MIRPLLVGLLVCLAVAAPSAAGGASADTEPAAGSYIVVFKADAVRSAADAPSQRPLVASTAADLARAHGGNVTFVYQHALKGFAARLSPVRAEALAADPRVAYVEPDQVVDALAAQSPATWGLDRTETVRLQFRATTDAILPTSFRILDRLRPPLRRGAQHSGPPARNAGHVATTSP